MADNVSALPELGTTYKGEATIADADVGQSAAIEGATKLFVDRAPGQAAGAKTRRSNRMRRFVLVRNVTGSALLPKRLVKWATGYRGMRVDGYVRLDYDEAAGVVDENLPAAGAPDNHLFWICTKGPHLVKTALAGSALNVITEGDILVALTAVTSGSTTSGRVFTAASTMTGNQALSAVGFAMSAKTTANTNADVLVDLLCMKGE